MLDVDGTLIPYDYNALPSDAVAIAIGKAQQKLEICLVTGRSYPFILNILEKLQLKKGFVIVNNGAQVIELSSKEVMYEQPLDLRDAEIIINLLDQEKIPFYLKQKTFDRSFINNYFKKGDPFQKAYMIFTYEHYSSKKIDDLAKKLSHLHNISVQKIHHKNPHKYGINITHVKATKLQGIAAVLKQLNLKKEEVIGVGDSYNDFPLLMACGLKVAMGNAVPDLKAIADYIAPSVTEDGVVDVVNKFILSS